MPIRGGRSPGEASVVRADQDVGRPASGRVPDRAGSGSQPGGKCCCRSMLRVGCQQLLDFFSGNDFPLLLPDKQMPLSVLVVDDSPIARKMLIRSLPPNWDIEITQAGGGAEALAAYRSGKVDVMFLDLTMPDIDGYQVLETLRHEDMNCLVIVVSADVQQAAVDRVLALGAIAFIKKPVDAARVEEVLRRYGIIV